MYIFQHTDYKKLSDESNKERKICIGMLEIHFQSRNIVFYT